MKISPSMFALLNQLQVGKTTAFGYTTGTHGKTYVNGKTVQALIRRELLVSCGEMPWQTYTEGEQLRGHFVPIYCISDKGREVLLDAGATIQIDVEPFPVDPWLVQKAIDLQAQERFNQWKQAQEHLT